MDNNVEGDGEKERLVGKGHACLISLLECVEIEIG